MKKFYAIFLAVATLSAAPSCMKEADADAPQQYVVKARVTSDETRVGYSFQGGVKQTWENGDQLFGYFIEDSQTHYITYTVSAVDGSGTATLSSEDTRPRPGTRVNLVHAPGKSVSDFSGTKLSLDLSSQALSAEPVSYMHASAVAETGGITFNFANSCALIRVNGLCGLPEGASLSSIKVRNVSLEGEFAPNKSGKIEFKASDEVGTLIIDASKMSADNSGNLDCDLFVTVAPGSSDGDLALEVVLSDGAVSYINLGSKTVEAGNCYRLTGKSLSTVKTGDCTQIQKGTSENLNLVVMGDGFTIEDFESGYYQEVMESAAAEFFVPDPLDDFKANFNVYIIDVVSNEHYNVKKIYTNGADVGSSDTALGVVFEKNSTSISGDNATIAALIDSALGEGASYFATTIVVANLLSRSGTCHQSVYSWTQGGVRHLLVPSIAYMALGKDDDEFAELVHHEASGHGFGHLGDEYYYSQTYTDKEAAWSNMDMWHDYGFSGNVSKYVVGETDSSTVFWHRLMNTSNDYESKEGLGYFEGAYTVSRDFCRPTENGNNSIMNHNTGIFNAPSRYSIFYWFKYLSEDTIEHLDSDFAAQFISWEASRGIPTITAASCPTSVPTYYDKRDELPFAPPVIEIIQLDSTPVRR